jgi:ubiquinone/menaquinone biosynthesis C-methylase UbiE
MGRRQHVLPAIHVVGDAFRTMPFLTPLPRRRESEWMDDDGVAEGELRRSLRFIQRINSTLGYTRSIIHHLESFSKRWGGTRIDIIDLATGSADIPRAVLAWAHERNLDVHITAVDRHPVTARVAAEGTPDPSLRIVQADVFNLPFADRSFDYALSAMFLHHLDEPQIVNVLRTMDRLARHGIIAADLLRHRRALAWIRLFTAFSPAMIRHDAVTSVRQALTKPEILALRDEAGVGYASYHRHFGHRFVLAGEKR